MINKEKVLNLLGMAQKAGKIASGDFIVERMVKRKQVGLLFLANDVAANNKKKYEDLCKAHDLEACTIFSKKELGQAIGKEQRVVLVVDDPGFAKAIRKLLTE